MKKEDAVKASDVTEETKERARKRLAEMNLLDDFLFGSVVTFPEIGEQFVRILLKIIFGREFKYLSVTAQKVLYGTDSDRHGARLDVCIEPEEREAKERVTVYDIEPDRNDKAEDKRTLPRRVRFYHGMILVRSLNSGAGYDKLKNVVVITVLPFDPFGLDRMVYTVKNHCMEEPEMEYEDGATTLFLYTRGTKGVKNQALEQLLHYMEESSPENAVNADLKEVHRMVEVVKTDAGTTISCVRLMEKLKRSEAIGREVGEEIGRAEGEAIGRARGEATGREKGRTEELVTRVCRKRKLGQSLEKIAEDLVEDVAVIGPIYHAAEQFAPEYAPEAVLQKLSAGKI